ncbi:histidine phosphatase family protein [Patescibacteria group bacterium]|nr:histidine phosphatase family protein [Patescibacteria group bacterium]
MALKKLIVVRHGKYAEKSLTAEGRRQVAELATALAIQLHQSSIALLSSTATRAKETSVILAAGLGGITFEEHECLFSGGYNLDSEQVEETFRLLEENGSTHDVVILSTHMEFIDQFPTIWGKKHGFQIQKSYDTPKGTARLVNVETGKVEDIHPTSTF